MSKQLDRVLTSLPFAIGFVLSHFNTIDIEDLRAENELLKHSLSVTQQEVNSLRKHIDERTDPATIQREQFNWIMRGGDK